MPLWVGRDVLLTELTAEILGGRKVLALCGQGGIGKTSLAVKVLEACGVLVSVGRLGESCVFERVIYVRVTEGMSFDGVVVELARSLEVSLNEGLMPERTIDLVIGGLQRSQCLVVLDNLEDVLREGRSVSREWGLLLWALVEREHRSQVVITSREVPKDLADPRDPHGVPNPSVVRVETIHGIDQTASVKLLKDLGLRDSDADLEWVAQRVDGLVLVLTLLAKWAKKPGMLRKRPDLVTQDARPILRAQLARQSEGAIDLLKRMCVLRVEIEIEGLTFLRLYQDDDNRFRIATETKKPAELLPEEIKETQVLVDALLSCSLVQSRYNEQCCTDSYDLHRVIIEFMQNTCQSELPELIENVYSFYKSGMSIENPKTLEDLSPLLEAQHFAFQLGSYGEAWSILSWRLEQYLNPWGHWTLLQDLLGKILPHIQDKNKGRCLCLLGGIERHRGNWDNAEQLFQQSIQVLKKLGNSSSMAYSWGALGCIERDRGNNDKAKIFFQQSLQLSEEMCDRSSIASSRSVLGHIEFDCGNWDDAEQLLKQSFQDFKELGNQSGMAYSRAVLGDIEHNRGNWTRAENLYRQALKLRKELGDRLGMAEMNGCLGENELGRGNLDQAEALLKQALSQIQQLGMVSAIAEINYGLAKLYRAKDNPTKAQEHYAIAHQIFTDLGAMKDVEKMENEEW